MQKSSIYVDTSVIGGCYDPEFQQWSNGLLADINAGKYSLFLSELSDAEVQDAPEEVRKIYLEFRNCAKRILELKRLQGQTYWLAGILSMSSISKRFRNSTPLILRWVIKQF